MMAGVRVVHSELYSTVYAREKSDYKREECEYGTRVICRVDAAGK